MTGWSKNFKTRW